MSRPAVIDFSKFTWSSFSGGKDAAPDGEGGGGGATAPLSGGDGGGARARFEDILSKVGSQSSKSLVHIFT